VRVEMNLKVVVDCAHVYKKVDSPQDRILKPSSLPPYLPPYHTYSTQTSRTNKPSPCLTTESQRTALIRSPPTASRPKTSTVNFGVASLWSAIRTRVCWRRACVFSKHKQKAMSAGLRGRR